MSFFLFPSLGQFADKMSTSETAARSEESFASTILGVTTVFHILALVVVGLRSYTRLFLVRMFGIQDAFMILSIVR